MKHQFFNPALIGHVDSKPGHLSRMVSRRFRGTSRHGSSCYKTEGGDPDPEGKKEDLLKKVKASVAEEMNQRGATKEVIDGVTSFMENFKQIPLEALREMANAEKGAMATLAAYGNKLQEMEDKIAANKNPEDLSVRSQTEKFFKANGDAIKAVREGGNKQALQALPAFELETRAVANPMLPSTVNPTGSMFIGRFGLEPGVSQNPLPVPTFWDYLRKPQTNLTTIAWVNKLPREGDAAFIAPGVYKPNISFTFDTDISTVKKVADSAKMATELLEDIDGFADFVENELENTVMMKVNEKLTTGVASSTVPAGVRTLSVPFQGVTLGVKTTNPNMYDAIKAAETQLVAQPRFQNRRIVTFINPIDRANMEMTKAVTQGQLFIPYRLTSTLVDDPTVPVGYFQMCVIDAYEVRIYKGFRIAWGLENDDFTKNLVTAIGEMRLHQFMKDANIGAFIYDTFANVIAAIQ